MYDLIYNHHIRTSSVVVVEDGESELDEDNPPAMVSVC